MPAIRAISALTLLVLGVALADDASHAVPLDDLAVLANRLHAAANFHRELRTNVKNYGQDSENNGLSCSKQGIGAISP